MTVASLFLAMALAVDGEGVTTPAALASEIDQTFRAEHEARGIPVAPPAPDAQWLRRTSLLLRGVIPTAAEVERFLASTAEDRRAQKIDEYLADPRFSRSQAERWSALLLTEAGVLSGRMDRLLRPWIQGKLENGAGFDEITRGILTASGPAPIFHAAATEEMLAEGATPVGFVMAYHDSIETTAGISARVFLGLQIQCAQCHDSFFDEWRQDEFNRFTAFFSDLHGQYLRPSARNDRRMDPAQRMSPEERRARREQRTRGTAKVGRANAVFAAVDMGLEEFLRTRLDEQIQRGGRAGPSMAAMSREMGAAEVQRERNPVSPESLEALRQLQVVIERSEPGTDPLSELEADPAALEALTADLPIDMVEAVDVYRFRRDTFGTAGFLDGSAYEGLPDQGRRAALAAWVTSPQNPWYAKAIVNRLWGQMFGHGLTEPIDDLSGPSDRVVPELLDRVADAFVKSGYDVRFLLGTLARTEAFARSRGGGEDEQDWDRVTRWFAAYPTRPMNSHQFLESALRALGGDRPGVGQNRKRLLSDLESAFEYDSSGLWGEARPSIAQSLFLMNSSTLETLSRQLSVRHFPKLGDDDLAPVERLRGLFLALLGRPPVEQEAQQLVRALDEGERKGPAALRDLIWAIVNSTEFHSIY